MALPTTITNTTPAQTLTSPSNLGTQARQIKVDIQDLLGIPNAVAISTAGLAFAADGMTQVVLSDSSGTVHNIQNTGVQFNEQGLDIDFRIEGNNTPNLFNLDAGQDAISFGGANVDGCAIAFNNLQQRTHVTSVGSQTHIPAQTTDFDNPNGTIAVGSAAFFGIPTWTNANATLTMTEAGTVVIAGAPVDSTNVTITTAHALWVQAGSVKFSGTLDVTGDADVDGAINMTATTVTAGALFDMAPGHAQRDLVTSVGMGVNLQADTWDVNAAGNGETVAIGSLAFLGIPTWTSTGTTFTVTTAATLYVQGAPVGSTNVTVSNGYALWLDAGAFRLDAGAILTNAGANTVTLPTSTDTLVGKATTDTLTNKSVDLANNTLTGTTAEFNTALSDDSFATLAGSETLTNKTLTSPIIANIAPGANFTLTQNSVAAITSVESGAIVNTLFLDAGVAYIGAIANANMTAGLTIDQSTADDQIFALKSSTDVATVLTTGTLLQDVETDDILTISKSSSTSGGITLQVLAESGNATAFFHDSYGGAPATTNTDASLAAMNWFVAEHDGSNGLNDLAADSNGFAWGEIDSASARKTRMLLEVDNGELHLGTTTIAQLDDHDDLALLEDFENYRTDCQLKTAYQDMLTSGCYERLAAIGVISRVGDAAAGVTEEQAWNDGVRPLHSVQRLAQLSIGEARQKQKRLEAILEVLESTDPTFKGKLNAAMVSRGIGHLVT